MSDVPRGGDHPDLERLRLRAGEALQVTGILGGRTELHYFEAHSASERSSPVRVEVVEGVEYYLHLYLDGFYWRLGRSFRHWREDFDVAHSLVLALAKRGSKESAGSRCGVRYADQIVTLDDGRELVYRKYPVGVSVRFIRDGDRP